ncbi:MAG: hypothetical protein ING26_04420 [Roseomonas sp.]|nr:hypothetical protein [Roseomonas sp.]
MDNVINQILQAAFSEPLNTAFCASILLLTGIAILGVITRSTRLARLSAAAPSLLTTIGVLGTFVGILIGLMNFDVADISKSVPQLLEGMKTAFVTSVFGMSGGISVKLVSELVGRNEGQADSQGVEDVLLALADLKEEEIATRKELSLAMDRIRQGLTGDAESSLVTQIQRLRNDVTDEIKNSRKSTSDAMNILTNEIQKISSTLLENTSKAITEALERSIRDFNEKITEQFGDNFKELNVAVGRLLVWQEEYRQQMEANATALKAGVAGIQASQGALDAIGVQAASLVLAAADMKALLDGIGKTKAELDARLEAFRDMAKSATSALPIIQNRVEDLTTRFSAHVESASQRLEKTAEVLQSNFLVLEQSLRNTTAQFVEGVTKASQDATKAAAEAAAQQEKMLGSLSRGYEKMRDDAQAIGAELRGTIQQTGDSLRANLSEAAELMRRAVDEQLRAITQEIRGTTNEEFRRIASSLDSQIKQLDDSMTKELERALSAMGSQLVSLTEKFVTDYRIVTDSLRDTANTVRRGTQ